MALWNLQTRSVVKAGLWDNNPIAVQVGTAVFYDPSLPERIVAWLEEHGLPASIR